MKKNQKTNIIMFVLALLNFVSFYAFRFGWHFEQWGIRLNLSYAMILLVPCLIFSFYILYRGSVSKKRILLYIGNALGLLLNLGYFALRLGDWHAYARNFFESLLVVLPSLIAGLLLFMPLKNDRKARINKCIILCLVVLSGFIYVYDFFPISFESEPVVFDAGDKYAVVFTTNVNGLGYLELEKDGVKKTYYHTEDGKRIAMTENHRVYVDKSELEGATYRAYVKRLFMNSPNKAVFGRTIKSESIKFREINNSDSLKFISLSDYHSLTASPVKISKSIRASHDIDFLYLLGDNISFTMDSREVIASVLSPAAKITRGEIPVYFTRGNHELFAGGSSFIDDFIVMPQNKFYYTFSYGKFYGITLDLGLDKTDDHYTYGGLADCSAYRNEQTEWLKKVIESKEYENYEYFGVFSHVPLNSLSTAYKDTALLWSGMLSPLSPDFAISGHTHKFKMTPPDDKRSFPVIEDGGKKSDYTLKTVGSLVIIDNGKISVEAYEDSSTQPVSTISVIQ